MTARIRVKEPTLKRVVDSGRTLRRINPDEVASALSAEQVQEITERLGPVSLFHLRAQLLERLESSGGRPGLSDVSRRVKIPVTDADWSELERLANKISSPGLTPSAGQVASVLLSSAIRMVSTESE